MASYKLYLNCDNCSWLDIVWLSWSVGSEVMFSLGICDNYSWPGNILLARTVGSYVIISHLWVCLSWYFSPVGNIRESLASHLYTIVVLSCAGAHTAGAEEPATSAGTLSARPWARRDRRARPGARRGRRVARRKARWLLPCVAGGCFLVRLILELRRAFSIWLGQGPYMLYVRTIFGIKQKSYP